MSLGQILKLLLAIHLHLFKAHLEYYREKGLLSTEKVTAGFNSHLKKQLSIHMVTCIFPATSHQIIRCPLFRGKITCRSCLIDFFMLNAACCQHAASMIGSRSDLSTKVAILSFPNRPSYKLRLLQNHGIYLCHISSNGAWQVYYKVAY